MAFWVWLGTLAFAAGGAALYYLLGGGPYALVAAAAAAVLQRLGGRALGLVLPTPR